MLLFLIFSIFLYVTANPVPLNSIDLSTNGDSFSVDIDDVAKVGCNKDTASIEFSNEGDDNDVTSIASSNEDDDNDMNILRRGTSCPAAGTLNPPNGISGKVWKAPAVLSEPFSPGWVATSADRRLCTSNPMKKILFTCTGPEVWYKNVIGFVLHCFGGKSCSHHDLINDWFSLGPWKQMVEGEPWPANAIINLYCCHEGVYKVSSCLS